MQDTGAAVAGLAEGESESLKAVLDELQSQAPGNLKFTVVTGANHATDIAVAGIKTTDILVAVLGVTIVADTGSGATGNKVTSVATVACTITSTGHIQITAGDTFASPCQLVVVWVANT